MMSGARLEYMLAVRGRPAARWTDHYRRALVARLIDLCAVADVALLRLPGGLELRLVARRVVAAQKCSIVADAGGDEILRNLLEDRPALVAVGLQECLAAPTVKL